MKLLFDQNISFRIIKKIETEFPEASQVRVLGLENKTDLEIWHYAKSHHFSIVTFDADFFDLTVLKGHPPKIVWIRSGNTSTSFLAEMMIKNKEVIQKFLESDEWDEIGCLELDE
jgi:predicted nuclease of predicted toxin-antitoxin system